MKKLKNPFALYTGGKYSKLNTIATEEILKGIKSGEITLRNVGNNPILIKHRIVGATDTESRSVIYDYIQERNKKARNKKTK